MRIDWIIGFVTFLMFIIWAFSYYSLIGTAKLTARSDAALSAADGIISYLKADFTSMPANITSPASFSGTTVWAYVNRTDNSTRVVTSMYSNESLYCMLLGNRVYWTADLSAGGNSFFIERADLDTPLACNGTLPQGDGNQTTTWAEEGAPLFSAQRNADVCALMTSDYDGVRQDAGSTFD